MNSEAEVILRGKKQKSHHPLILYFPVQPADKRLFLIISVIWMIVSRGDFPASSSEENKPVFLPILWGLDANIQRHRQAGAERVNVRTGHQRSSSQKKKKNKISRKRAAISSFPPPQLALLASLHFKFSFGFKALCRSRLGAFKAPCLSAGLGTEKAPCSWRIWLANNAWPGPRRW